MTELADLGQSATPRYHLEFVTTAQMSVDAQSAAGSPTMNMFHVIGDTAVIIVGLVFAFAGYVLGYLAIIVGVLFLFVSQVAPFQRWLVTRYRGEMLGQPVTVDIDDSELRFTSPLISTTVPWSTITEVRASDRSVAFLRGRSPVGYLPAVAFAGDSDRLAFVEYARRRTADHGEVTRG
jgi:hypothetical protein